MTSKRQEQVKIIEKLSRKKDKDSCCHFHKPEIEKLVTMYNKYVEGCVNRKLDRLKFRDILHDMFGMTDDMLMDRESSELDWLQVYDTLMKNCFKDWSQSSMVYITVFRAFDKDNDNYLNHDEWVLGLSVFLKGHLEETTKYCFVVYDLNGDGFISREEMFQLLKNSLVKQPTEEDPDEGVKELVELSLKKMDHDHDSRLSPLDFETAVKEDPLLLEAFGPCLPNPEKRQCFLNLISDEYSNKF